MAPSSALLRIPYFFVTPEWAYLQQTVLQKVHECDVEEWSSIFMQYILIPFIFAYLWSPQKINIIIPNQGRAIVRTGPVQSEHTLDSTSKDILAQIRQHEGVTAKMLHRALQVYDQDVEEFDVNGSLYNLQRANLITQVQGRHSAPLWVAY